MILFFIPTLTCLSQGMDATLAAMITEYTKKAEKQYKSQQNMMFLETEGHLWIKEEVEGTTNLQREFNEYLSSFRSIICYAAQIYGFYHEIDKLVYNFGSLSDQFKNNTSNAFALALYSKRNKIYRDLILNSVDIVNDIRIVCLSDNKMTEKERIEIVFKIRPKLQVINLQLRRLIRAIKYTSFSDIWGVIDEESRDEADKQDISHKCLRRWRKNASKCMWGTNNK